DDPPFGNDPGVAQVVPAVGSPILVGIGLEVLEPGWFRPHDLGFLGPDQAGIEHQPEECRQNNRTPATHGPVHGFPVFRSAVASRWARPVIGTKSVERSSRTSTSLPPCFVFR